jgi:hypothetical protein
LKQRFVGCCIAKGVCMYFDGRCYESHLYMHSPMCVQIVNVLASLGRESAGASLAVSSTSW